MIDTIDLTVTSPRPRKFQYKKPKASLTSKLFDDDDESNDILSSVMEKIEGKREEKVNSHISNLRKINPEKEYFY